MTEPYDSTEDTERHINQVAARLIDAQRNLMHRGFDHDRSKIHEPEKSMYDEYTPKLRALTYGSDEYKASLAAMGPALQHHYAHNSHHPEHYPNGINDMSLFDLIEMLCDWHAAVMRHADGDFTKSLEINRARFGISDQLFRVLVATAREMGWLE